MKCSRGVGGGGWLEAPSYLTWKCFVARAASTVVQKVGGEREKKCFHPSAATTNGGSVHCNAFVLVYPISP